MFQQNGILYLILAIFSSASMTLALRFFQKTDGNRYGILLGNYITCIILAFLMLKPKVLFPEGVSMTLLCGVTDGVIFVVSLVLMQTNIRVNGIVLTSAFSRLGLLVPLALGLAVFAEKPDGYQLFGIVLVILALLILNLFGDEAEKQGEGMVRTDNKPGFLLLFALLFFYGCGDAMSKVFERVGSRGQDALFFFYVFLTAGILCAILTVIEKKRTGKPVLLRDLAAGTAVGIPNYFASSLLLKALTKLPSFFVYPCASTGVILVVTLFGTLLFHEKITKGKWAALGVIAAAIIFLNI